MVQHLPRKQALGSPTLPGASKNAECQRRWRKAHSTVAWAKTKVRTATRITLRKQIITDGKRKPCVDCEIEYAPYVMDYDHVRGEKCFNLSGAAERRIRIELILAEIEKCDVVCSNCHRERTHQRRVRPVVRHHFGKVGTSVRFAHAAP